ncbi:hypothetical protein D6D24_03849 [Aureobasidium pullulans]|uniref:Uncharacterized protein n=1 Tax=Aureobasidium pullulans TaxID=5580 RepID=A0A4S8VYB3_AURPU|nr:hypothetical protein D6D24_03849 [Aureobasidium pullulans]
MASAVPAAASQAPWTAFESRKVGLVSIVEEELVAGCQSPLASSTLQTPQWRDVDYFDNAKSSRAKGLGVTSVSHTGSPLVMSSRNSSPGASPNPSSPRLTTLGWGMVPPRQTSPLGTASPILSPMEIWDKGPSVVPKLSSVIPDISDDEASRHGSIADIEIILRKASIALSQLDGYTTTKSDIEILINEESDVLGPLHSPSTPLTPSIRTPLSQASPRASPRASSECLGRAPSNDDQSAGTATPPIGKKRPLLEPSVVFKKFNNFADLHSFSFGQGPKGRKESAGGQDPMSSPRMSAEGSIQRPSSARVSLGSSIDSEITRDVMLINPVTGERKMSAIRPSLSVEQLRRPSALRRSSSATSMYTLVRRESLSADKLRTRSTASRPSLSGRNTSIPLSSDQRPMSTEAASQTRTPSFATDQRTRNYSSSTRHLSSASNARTMSSSRNMSHSSYARTMSSTRTMSNSTWSRTMSTFSRASSTTSVTTCDFEADRNICNEIQDTYPDEQPRRKSSLLVPLFGNFQWRKPEPAITLPIQEPVPAYQEALADVEEDPDFVEVEIEPKAGSVSRRASLIANIFTSNDVDVDPDLKFEPSASETQIKQGVAEAQVERSQRKMLYSRNVATASLGTINAICVVLSFGLFTVWYAVSPLVLVAPLLRSVMVLQVLGDHLYTKVRSLLRPQQDRSESPAMDYATVLSFSNETQEMMESTLDSLVNQQGIDMSKNLLIISCNDQMLDSTRAKTTTRILLEHVFTNIVDEAKFQIPREDDEYEFDALWCRRGIYKGLPYILMVKEGGTAKVENLNLIRNLVHSYNLRKESYHNTAPSAFFAWYKEWAELHDFASFDFLVNVSSNTALDERCILELYRQSLTSSTSVAISSRVEIEPSTYKWSLGNLFDNAHLMYDQVRQSHQSQFTHKVNPTPDACQMLKVCEETCGQQTLEDIKGHHASPMSNMVKQMCSTVDEDDMTMHASSGITTQQALHAVTYARPSITLSEFFVERQRLAFLTCAVNLAIVRNSQTHWFERLSSGAELLAWCLPIFSLAIIVNFIRAAAMAQNIPVLIVLSAVALLPWVYGFTSAMWLARSWEAKVRYVLGFFIMAVAGPFVAIYAVASTVLNLHRVRQRESKSRHPSATTKIMYSGV